MKKKIILSRDVMMSNGHKNLKLLVENFTFYPMDTFEFLLAPDWFLDWKIDVCNRQIDESLLMYTSIPK